MPVTAFEIFKVLDDGTTVVTSKDAVSDHDQAFLVTTDSIIYVLPTTSVRISAIAQRIARNMRLSNALRQELDLVGLGDREQLLASLEIGPTVKQPIKAPEVVQEQTIIPERDYTEFKTPLREPTVVTTQVETVEASVEPVVQVPELKSVVLTDEDFLVRIFAAHMLGAPLRDIRNLLTAGSYSEGQKTLFESKILRFLQNFLDNLE